MTALEEVGLGDNKLTGSIPTELGSISRLKNIELNNNILTGPIPTEFGLLTALQDMAVGKVISFYKLYVEHTYILNPYQHILFLSILSNI